MKRYSIEDYQKLHTVVYQFKEGSKEAGEEILNLFEPFILKFVNFLMDGNFYIEDSNMRNFTALFFTDQNIPLRRYKNSYREMSSVRNALFDTSGMITDMLSIHGREDITSAVQEVILDMANRYHDDKPSFHNYIDKCFYQHMFKYINRYYTKDPVSNASRYWDKYHIDTRIEDQVHKFENNFDRHLKVKEYIESSVPLKAKNICVDPYSDKIFDISWEAGYTCNEIFSCLTIFERRIFKMYYVDNMTDEEIALECGFCRATINRKRLSAFSKLRSGYYGSKEESQEQISVVCEDDYL